MQTAGITNLVRETCASEAAEVVTLTKIRYSTRLALRPN